MTCPSGPPFYGKYRGLVTDVQDPMFLGRVRARVPDVYGDQESGWALPCAPFGGSNTGLFALPKVGAGVWIEFEHGDPEYPIWAGVCWTSPADRPPALLIPLPYKKTLIQTEGGHQIILDDSPTGGITLQTSGGQKIEMTPTGIVIDNGLGAKIELQAVQAKVSGTMVQVG